MLKYSFVLNTQSLHVKFKILCKTKSRELQVSTLIPYPLYSKLSFRILKQHTKSLKKDEIPNLRVLPTLWRVCLTCAHANLKIGERVSNVHEVNINRTQLLSMSYNHVQYKQPFCITEYTYCHRLFYLFFSHLNHARLNFVAGYTILPP